MTDNKILFERCRNEVKIERDDIEQALSWYHRLRPIETTTKDRESFDRLLQIILKMISLGIGDR